MLEYFIDSIVIMVIEGLRMPHYTIVNESTEDTLETADNLPDAVRLARQAAKRGAVGDLVSVLDGDGKSVGQLVLLPDGTVQKHPVGPANQPIDVSRL